MVLFLLFTSKRTFKDIPLARSCSAAIFAACHGGQNNAASLPVQWGMLPTGYNNFRGGKLDTGVGENKDGSNVGLMTSIRETLSKEPEEEVGHCAFSADEVEILCEGKLYAGVFRKRV